ncbi:MAG TPA: hypothetical protein VNC40_04250, partial [Gaiellaceae bacterium]|nr:hypothetical protein [Gaiellaceae bacterium]
SIPRRPLVVYAPVIVALIVVVLEGAATTADLVRATSACFIAVYVLALASAARILDGKIRVAAGVSFALALALAVFSAGFLAVPVVMALLAVGLRRRLRRSRALTN